jgi:hypothetical protein
MSANKVVLPAPLGPISARQGAGLRSPTGSRFARPSEPPKDLRDTPCKAQQRQLMVCLRVVRLQRPCCRATTGGRDGRPGRQCPRGRNITISDQHDAVDDHVQARQLAEEVARDRSARVCRLTRAPKQRVPTSVPMPPTIAPTRGFHAQVCGPKAMEGSMYWNTWT